MVEQAPVGVGGKFHQEVYVAVRAKIVPQGGSEQGQLRDPPFSTENGQSFRRQLQVSVHD